MKEKSLDWGGRKFNIKTDYLAKQASGAVLAEYGESSVVAATMMGRGRPGMDYFPLLIDYEEKLYAAGKIKGSRFIKREGRASDDAILSARLIDRGIRPLFEDNTRSEVQIVATIMSADDANDPDIIAANAASCALMISDIPWEGPLATVRVGRIGDEYIINPTFEQRDKSELDLIISSTGESIVMVEAGASFVTEEDIVGGIEFAQKFIEEMINFQNDLAKEFGKEKKEMDKFEVREEIIDFARENFKTDLEEAMYAGKDTVVRDESISKIKDEFLEKIEEKYPEDETAATEATDAFSKITKEIIRANILEKERRLDGRNLDETRNVTAEVGIFPRTHGSAVFTRGETQVVTTVTLGAPGDVQLLESLEEDVSKRYMHHYNMPGYSFGEVKPLRGPGRREIGHGALAERALIETIPEKESFPYTIRVVSEVMASNGSTSMASTCGSSLALMDAGVQIKDMVGGVAMGLILDTETGNFKVLTDIQGIEDGNGDMDFKVTGTEKGITAMQMDVKTRGINASILSKALEQAKNGRLHILSKMKEAITAPRPEMSKYAPRITSFKIDPEKIGTVIGSGGKTIQEITKETGVDIDIDDDGTIMITSEDGDSAKRAEQWIKDLVKEVEAGEEYTGTVTRIMDFGAFVEVLPGKEGLVHISKFKSERVEKVSDVAKVGDKIEVVVEEIDSQGRINLITKEAYKAKGKNNKDRHGGSGDRRR